MSLPLEQVSGVMISRRQLLHLLGSAPLLSAGAVGLAVKSSTNASAKNGREAVMVRRIVIPAPGLTLPVVLARPAEGRHPAVILLDDHIRQFARDDRELFRCCAGLASEGRVLIVPLRMRDQDASLAALHQYAGRHPAIVGAPTVISA